VIKNGVGNAAGMQKSSKWHVESPSDVKRKMRRQRRRRDEQAKKKGGHLGSSKRRKRQMLKQLKHVRHRKSYKRNDEYEVRRAITDACTLTTTRSRRKEGMKKIEEEEQKRHSEDVTR